MTQPNVATNGLDKASRFQINPKQAPRYFTVRKNSGGAAFPYFPNASMHGPTSIQHWSSATSGDAISLRKELETRLVWLCEATSILEWTSVNSLSKLAQEKFARLSRCVGGWNGAPSTPAEATDSNCHLTKTFYDMTNSGVVTQDPIREEVWIQGQKMSETSISWTYGTSGGLPVKIATRLTSRKVPALDASDADGYEDNPAAMMSRTTAYGEDAGLFLAGRVLREEHEDGRVDVYSYVRGDWDPVTEDFTPLTTEPTGQDGRAIKTTVLHTSAWAPSGGMAGCTLTTTITDKFGREALVIEQLWKDSLHWWTPGITRHTYDDDDHLITTTVNEVTVLQQSWDELGRLASRIDQNGIETDYEYDVLGRVWKETRKGIAAATGYEAQPDIVTEYTYDAADRVIQTSRSAGSLTLTTSKTYDLAGRVLTSTDEAGLVTTYEYTSDQETTVTHPNGGTEITATTIDGLVTGVTGTAVLPRGYEYSVIAPGILVTHEWNGDALRWTKRHTSGGQTLKEIRPGVDGTTLLQTQWRYNEFGQLARVDRPGQAPELTGYDGFGRVIKQGLELDNNGSLNADWLDRYQSTSYAIVFDAGVGLFERVTTQTLSKNNDASQALTTVTDRLLGGDPRHQLTRRTNPDGTTEEQESVIDAGAKSVISYSRSSRATNEAISYSVNGLLISQSSPSVTVPAIFKYDALGRRTHVKDPRTGLETITAYDSAGRVSSTTDALSHTTSYAYYGASEASPGQLKSTTPPATDAGSSAVYQAYDLLGRTTHQWGPGTYPVKYEYNSRGEKWKMHTYRTDESAGSPWSGSTLPSGFSDPGDVTQWLNNAYTGQLEEKRDAAGKGTTYAYTAATGRLLRRTWARLVDDLPLTTTYTYNATGEITGIDYSDATPDVTITVDRLGRPTQIVDGSGTRVESYTGPGEALASESNTTSGLATVYGYDSEGRVNSTSAKNQGDAVSVVAQTYNAATGRLATVAKDGITVTYAYETNADLISGVSYSGGAAISGQRTWNDAGQLTDIHWKVGTTTVDRRQYLLDAQGKRTQATMADNKRWAYGYDTRGQVTTAARQDATGSPLVGGRWGYKYDAIGNRISSTERSVADDSVLTTSYDSTTTNAYSARHTPDPARQPVRGRAHADASVVVKTYAPGQTTPEQTLTAARDGEEFSAEPSVTNSATHTNADQAWRKVRVEASRTGVGVSGGTVTTKREGALWFPPQDEALSYDDDGNLTRDARWHYLWDAENRLIQMQTTSEAIAKGVPGLRLTFTYDQGSRRTRKLVEAWDGGTSSWHSTSDLWFLYDGWNLIGEFTMQTTLSLTRSYAWGLDLSGSGQGAGGVGGLLLVKAHAGNSTLLVPSYDGNGNVTAYLNAQTGTLLAVYDCDAFGRVVVKDDSALPGGEGGVPFQFSTKYADIETSLLYYGNRYLDISLGRWLSRDPLGEMGGLGLYCMAVNDSVNKWDRLGLAVGGFGDIPQIAKDPDYFPDKDRPTKDRPRLPGGQQGVDEFLHHYFHGKGALFNLHSHRYGNILETNSKLKNNARDYRQQAGQEILKAVKGICSGSMGGAKKTTEFGESAYEIKGPTTKRAADLTPEIFALGQTTQILRWYVTVKVCCEKSFFSFHGSIKSSIDDFFDDALDIPSLLPGKQEFPGGTKYPINSDTWDAVPAFVGSGEWLGGSVHVF